MGLVLWFVSDAPFRNGQNSTDTERRLKSSPFWLSLCRLWGETLARRWAHRWEGSVLQLKSSQNCLAQSTRRPEGRPIGVRYECRLSPQIVRPKARLEAGPAGDLRSEPMTPSRRKTEQQGTIGNHLWLRAFGFRPRRQAVRL